jgi:hypothetical protein
MLKVRFIMLTMGNEASRRGVWQGNKAHPLKENLKMAKSSTKTATPETATPETATPETATPETATPETLTDDEVKAKVAEYFAKKLAAQGIVTKAAKSTGPKEPTDYRAAGLKAAATYKAKLLAEQRAAILAGKEPPPSAAQKAVATRKGYTL